MMKLIIETNMDNVETSILEESSQGGKSYVIEGIFLQSEVKNKNGRVYPKPVLIKEVDRYVKEKINTKSALGELTHPKSFEIDPRNVSHIITELKESGNNFIGKAKIIKDNPSGSIVAGLINEGVRLGVSSRGVGTVKNRNGVDVVQEDFRMATAADIVMDPSAPDAFVNGIMENVEWIWENGKLSKIDLTKTKTRIKESYKRHDKKFNQEMFLKVFEKYLGKL